jgi:hypothetical protein
VDLESPAVHDLAKEMALESGALVAWLRRGGTKGTEGAAAFCGVGLARMVRGGVNDVSKASRRLEAAASSALAGAGFSCAGAAAPGAAAGGESGWSFFGASAREITVKKSCCADDGA